MIALLARACLLLGAWAAQEAPAQTDAPSREQRRIESLFGGALKGVRDNEEFTETAGYREMLSTVAGYGPDELREKRECEFNVAGALGSPNEWRGRIVHVRSLVAKLETVRLAQPLGDHVDVYRAFLVEADGSEGLVVDFLREPPELEVGKDVVDVEAVFFRIVTYENRKSDRVNVPQLIARDIRKFDQQEAPRKTLLSDPLAQVTLGAGVVYLVIRVVMTARRPKKNDRGQSKASRAIHERAGTPPRSRPHT